MGGGRETEQLLTLVAAYHKVEVHSSSASSGAA